MEDVKGVLACREWINARTHGMRDRTSVLGVVAAGKGAESYLPHTIPKIIRQASETGKGTDIVIGLNNGFECPPLLQRLASLPNAQVVRLYTEEKRTSTLPARVFADCRCEGEPYRLGHADLARATHRIFVVHQRAGPYAPGKIRILGDIYGSLLVESIGHGWVPPELLIAFDAESQFFAAQEGAIPDPESNGLRLMVNKLQTSPEIDLLVQAPDMLSIERSDRWNGSVPSRLSRGTSSAAAVFARGAWSVHRLPMETGEGLSGGRSDDQPARCDCLEVPGDSK
jgi:hypothetical protein